MDADSITSFGSQQLLSGLITDDDNPPSVNNSSNYGNHDPLDMLRELLPDFGYRADADDRLASVFRQMLDDTSLYAFQMPTELPSAALLNYPSARNNCGRHDTRKLEVMFNNILLFGFFDSIYYIRCFEKGIVGFFDSIYYI
jgi:hypothetical protein